MSTIRLWTWRAATWIHRHRTARYLAIDVQDCKDQSLTNPTHQGARQDALWCSYDDFRDSERLAKADMDTAASIDSPYFSERRPDDVAG